MDPKKIKLAEGNLLNVKSVTELPNGNLSVCFGIKITPQAFDNAFMKVRKSSEEIEKELTEASRKENPCEKALREVQERSLKR